LLDVFCLRLRRWYWRTVDTIILKKRSNFVKKSAILRNEKNRRFVIFWTPFSPFWSLLEPIGIYRKTGPTKSTVLGPGPPPWEFYKIYRNLRFFVIFGPSIQPEKASVKSASTPYPPWKVNFMVIFNLSRPNFVPNTIF
jgi:hypothetical protein